MDTGRVFMLSQDEIVKKEHEAQFPLGEPLFSVKELQAWRWQSDRKPKASPPEIAILCLQPSLYQYAQRRYRGKPLSGLFGNGYMLETSRGRAAVVGEFGLGAPAMAILIEEYFAFGVRRFLSIGVAGSIQAGLNTGDVVVCERALRGDGTSNRYLQPSPSIEADAELMASLKKHLSLHGLQASSGISWTTDAPYRETRQELDIYRREGVSTVDMEASAFYAVSKSLGAQAVSAFVVADRLLEHGWEPPDDPGAIIARLQAVLSGAVTGLIGEKR